MKAIRFVVLTVSGALFACAHTIPRPLADAREAYERAQSSPTAGLSPGELQQAKFALERAEEAYEEDPGSERVLDLAYVALRRTEVAESRARWRQARTQLTKAQAELAARERRTREQQAQQQLAEARVQQQRLQQQLDQQRQILERQRLEAERQRMAAEQNQLSAAEQQRIAQQRQQQEQRQRELQQEQSTQQQRIAELERQLEQERQARQQAQNQAEAVRDELERLGNVREEARGLVLTLPGNLLFRTGSTRLGPPAQRELAELAETIEKVPEATITVEGHTDATGPAEVNQELAFERAQAVRLYLISQGVDPRRIDAVGYGELRPVAENDSAEGRTQNRRVEIVLDTPQQGTGGTGGSGKALPPKPKREGTGGAGQPEPGVDQQGQEPRESQEPRR